MIQLERPQSTASITMKSLDPALSSTSYTHLVTRASPGGRNGKYLKCGIDHLAHLNRRVRSS